MDGLQGVRRRIADELVAVERECGHLSEFDHARLEKHASIFNRLLGSFGGSYAPLFAKIKSVYDRAIDERLKAVARLKPKEVILRSFDGFDLNLQSIHDTYHRQTQGDREKLAKLKPETDLLSKKLDKKQAQLDRVLAEEKEARDKMREMDEWQHTLIQHMRAWEKALQQLHHQADTNDDSAWKTNQDIARTRDKISNTMTRVDGKVGAGGDLEERQVELRTQVDAILKLHQSIQVCSADVRKTEKTVKEFRAKLSKMDNELRVQKERAVDRQSAVTPLPDWDDVATSLENVMPLDISSNPQGSGPERKRAKYKSTADLVTSLTDGIAKLSADLMEAKQDLLREATAQGGEEMQGRADSSSAEAKTKWLVCHGRANSVPPYLRATGRVKNKNFTRQQVLIFLDEFWDAKSAGSRSRAQSTADFLASFIRNKRGAGRIAVEWAYNLIYALKVYSADPDCETFNCILNGELPEDAHHGQRLLIANLLEQLKKADKQNHGGRMWGTLGRTEFAEVLQRQFPLKGEDDFKALRRAVTADQPLPNIRYGPLLEKNPETGLQGKFLETLREQYITDVQQTYPMVEAAIRNATLEANERTQKVVAIEGHQTYPYLQLLKQVPLFRHCEMSDDELEALILEMDIAEFHEEDIIIAEGTTASYAFVLEEGSAYVTKEGIAQPLNCNYQVGDFFGELGLTQGDARAANVIARAGPRGVCRCIRISGNAFNKIRLASHQNEALLNQRVMQYFMATKTASVGTRTSREENKELHSLVTYVKCIKEGFAAFDADMAEREVNRLLKVGLGIAPDDDDRAVSPRSPGADGESPRPSGPIIDDEMPITLASFMSNIRRTVIKRFAKPKQQTEGEKRAQFLRNISDTERERITECFKELDDSGDGTLDQGEVEGLLKRIYGMEPSNKQMARLMLEMDSDGNGLIDLDEFIGAMATVKEVRMAGDIFTWRQTFDRYDEDKSGELSADELKKMVSELWDMGSASLELMQFMLDEADVDGDGQIDWPEFCQMMQRMMNDDERNLEMKRQRTIVAAQGSPESKVVTEEGAQEALGRGAGIAKKMGWDIDLGLNDDPDAMHALWEKVADNDSAAFAGLQRGLLETFPVLEEVFTAKANGSRVTMRAFKSVLASASGKGGRDDGRISRDDFPRFIAYIEFFSNLWEHFVSLDEDKDGKLNVAEFKSAFHSVLPEAGRGVLAHLLVSTYKKRTPEEELDEFLGEQHAKCDGNGSGYVSFDEFCAWIASYYHAIATEK